MLRLFYIIFSLIILITGISFAVLNADTITLHYYFGELAIPLSLTIISAVIIGALLGIIASSSIIIRLKRDNAHLRKTSELAEKELTNLRTMPIKDKH
ncbi:MAG: LapA family protein [Thioalkalispiraceae bacterium]|jgi:putative membrane protein